MFKRKPKVAFREVAEDQELLAVSDRAEKIARLARIMNEEGITIQDIQNIVIYNALETIRDTKKRNMIITIINDGANVPSATK